MINYVIPAKKGISNLMYEYFGRDPVSLRAYWPARAGGRSASLSVRDDKLKIQENLKLPLKHFDLLLRLDAYKRLNPGSN